MNNPGLGNPGRLWGWTLQEDSGLGTPKVGTAEALGLGLLRLALRGCTPGGWALL